MERGAGDTLNLAAADIEWTIGEATVEFSDRCVYYEEANAKGAGRVAATDGGVYYLGDDDAVVMRWDGTSVYDGALVDGTNGAVVVLESMSDPVATFKVSAGRAGALAAAAGQEGLEEISLDEWKEKVSGDDALVEHIKAAVVGGDGEAAGALAPAQTPEVPADSTTPASPAPEAAAEAHEAPPAAEESKPDAQQPAVEPAAPEPAAAPDADASAGAADGGQAAVAADDTASPSEPPAEAPAAEDAAPESAAPASPQGDAAGTNDTNADDELQGGTEAPVDGAAVTTVEAPATEHPAAPGGGSGVGAIEAAAPPDTAVVAVAEGGSGQTAAPEVPAAAASAAIHDEPAAEAAEGDAAAGEVAVEGGVADPEAQGTCPATSGSSDGVDVGAGAGWEVAMGAREEVGRVRIEADETAARADVRVEIQQQWHALCRDKAQPGYAEFRQLELEVTELRAGWRQAYPEGRLLTARDNLALGEAAAREAVLKEEGEAIGQVLMAFVMSAAAAWVTEKKVLGKHTANEPKALSDDARCELERFMMSNEKVDHKMAHALRVVAAALQQSPVARTAEADAQQAVSPQCAGWLLKANVTGSAWHKKFFVLANGRLFMMNNEYDAGTEKVVFETGKIKLVELEMYNEWSSSTVVRPPVGNLASRLGFYVALNDTQYPLVHFCALTPSDRARWMTQLRRCIDVTWKVSPVLGSPLRHYREHSRYLHSDVPQTAVSPPFLDWLKTSNVLESVSPRRTQSQASPKRSRDAAADADAKAKAKKASAAKKKASKKKKREKPAFRP